MPGSPHHLPPDLRPINTGIQVLIHKSTNDHIIPSDQVKAMRDFLARFRVIGGPDDALDRVAEDEICELVAGEEGAG